MILYVLPYYVYYTSYTAGTCIRIIIGVYIQLYGIYTSELVITCRNLIDLSVHCQMLGMERDVTFSTWLRLDGSLGSSPLARCMAQASQAFRRLSKSS